jgi:hypothetical protein
MSDQRSIFKVSAMPSHSHSIISGTCKYLKDKDFVPRHSNFTVISTVRNFRLAPTDGD